MERLIKQSVAGCSMLHFSGNCPSWVFVETHYQGKNTAATAQESLWLLHKKNPLFMKSGREIRKYTEMTLSLDKNSETAQNPPKKV